MILGDKAHPEALSDLIDIEGREQASFAISAVAAQSAALAEGVYDVWAGVDCHIKVAATATDVTSANGYLLRANNTIAVFVRKNKKIGAISVLAGTLSFHMVG